MKTETAKDGRVFRKLEHALVWVCVETGEAQVFGDPRDVEPPEWNGDGPAAGCDEDDIRAHNCDAARCSSVSHNIVLGTIAGRDTEAAPERHSPEPLEWSRREKAHGDPVWFASLGPFRLAIGVECEWVWSWEIESGDDHDIARGSVYCELGDDEDAEWDHQGIEAAQRRAESVARALLGAPEPMEESEKGNE